MKSLLLILLLGSPANATYPDTVNDIGTRDALDYIDGKVSGAITAIHSLGGIISSTSTSTNTPFVYKTGDTMTGQLTLYGSTLTAGAGRFYGSTFTVQGATIPATGGTITTFVGLDGFTHYLHTFLSNGTFTPSPNLVARVLLVGAGGYGGGITGSGGGGGGGGEVRDDIIFISTGTGPLAVVVGPTNSSLTRASSSTFAGYEAMGGGSGGDASHAGYDGASGGGGSSANTAAGMAIYVAADGNRRRGGWGGTGYISGPQVAGGGGGGAGTWAANATAFGGGNGGAGTYSTIALSTFTTPVYYGGGGGGGCISGGTGMIPGRGGIGGGGAGGLFNPGIAGTSNTGGGGGGGGALRNGGSGIVQISYVLVSTPSTTVVLAEGDAKVTGDLNVNGSIKVGNDLYVGRSLYAVDFVASDGSLNSVIASTGVINADLQAYKTTVQVSTTAIYTALSSTAAAINAVKVSTGALYVALSSTASALMATQVSTGTLTGQMSNVYTYFLSTGSTLNLPGVAYTTNTFTMNLATVTLSLTALDLFRSTATDRLDNAYTYFLSTGTSFNGDISGFYDALAIDDDSHRHTLATLTGVRATTDTVSVGLIDLSTVTAAIDLKYDKIGGTISDNVVIQASVTANVFNIGYVEVSSVCPAATTCTAECTTGKVISGDCQTSIITSPLDRNRNSDTTYKCDTKVVVGITATARCGEF